MAGVLSNLPAGAKNGHEGSPEEQLLRKSREKADDQQIRGAQQWQNLQSLL